MAYHTIANIRQMMTSGNRRLSLLNVRTSYCRPSSRSSGMSVDTILCRKLYYGGSCSLQSKNAHIGTTSESGQASHCSHCCALQTFAIFALVPVQFEYNFSASNILSEVPGITLKLYLRANGIGCHKLLTHSLTMFEMKVSLYNRNLLRNLMHFVAIKQLRRTLIKKLNLSVVAFRLV